MITQCRNGGHLYEVAGDEAANEPGRLCPTCRAAGWSVDRLGNLTVPANPAAYSWIVDEPLRITSYETGETICGPMTLAEAQKELHRIAEMRKPVDAWSVKQGYTPASDVSSGTRRTENLKLSKARRLIENALEILSSCATISSLAEGDLHEWLDEYMYGVTAAPNAEEKQ